MLMFEIILQKSARHCEPRPQQDNLRKTDRVAAAQPPPMLRLPFVVLSIAVLSPFADAQLCLSDGIPPAERRRGWEVAGVYQLWGVEVNSYFYWVRYMW